MRLSLRNRLLIVITGALVFPTMLFLVYHSHTMRAILEQDALKRSSATINVASEHLISSIQETTLHTLILAHNPRLEYIMLQAASQTAGQAVGHGLADKLSQLTGNQSELIQFNVLDAQGRELASSDQSQDRQLLDRSRDPFIVATTQLSANRHSWGPVHVDYQFNQTTNSATIHCATIVVGTNQIITGLIEAIYRFPMIAPQATDEHYIDFWVVDGNGQTLAQTSEYDAPLNRISDGSQQLPTEFNAGTAIITKRIRPRGQATIDWTLVASISDDAISEQMSGVQGALLIGYLVSALLAVGLIYVVTKQSTTPLERLAEAAKELTGGSLPHELTRRQSIHEADTLASSLTWLHKRVQDGYRQLEDTITELESSRDSASGARRLVQNIIDSTPMAVWVCDLESRILIVNRWLSDRMRIHRDRFINQSSNDVLPHAMHAAWVDLRQAAIKGEVSHTETTWSRDAGPVIMRLTAFPLYDSDGNIHGIGTIAEDIGEAIALRRSVVMSQKMEAVGRVAGSVAHDFNNLLSVVQMNSERLSTHADPDVARRANEMVLTSQRASGIIRQLLAFSRTPDQNVEISDLARELLKLRPIVERLLEPHIRLNIKLGSGQMPARIDSERFAQVVINLAVNARDAMGENGALDIRMERRSIATDLVVDAHRIPAGEHVVIEFEDCGPGISSADLERIFDPFFTTKADGTGIGLATVLNTVKSAGGAVIPFSIPGTGTTFQIFLPVTQDDGDGLALALSGSGAWQRSEMEQPARTGDSVNAPTTSDFRILIVDDELSIAELIAETLRDEGFLISMHTDPLLALNEAIETPPDVIITDLAMPSMDGVTLLRTVSDAGISAPALCVSASHDGQEQAASVGARFLAKPFSIDALITAVGDILPTSPKQA